MLRQRVVPMPFYFSGPTYDSPSSLESSYVGPVMHVSSHNPASSGVVACGATDFQHSGSQAMHERMIARIPYYQRC